MNRRKPNRRKTRPYCTVFRNSCPCSSAVLTVPMNLLPPSADFQISGNLGASVCFFVFILYLFLFFMFTIQYFVVDMHLEGSGVSVWTGCVAKGGAQWGWGGAFEKCDKTLGFIRSGHSLSDSTITGPY